MSSRMLAALSLAAAFAAGIAPLPARAQDVPSYAEPAPQSQDETIQGRIESVDDAFHISVRDDRGFIDRVELHQGTIIVPRGLALAAGMSVTIVGRNAGTFFEANEIDTPYSYEGPAPAPVYYGDGWWYPGYAFGYGPAYCLGLGLGFGGTIIIVHEPFRFHPWHGKFGNGDGFGHHWRYPIQGSHPYPPGSGHVTTTAPDSGAQHYRTTAPVYRAAPPAGPAPHAMSGTPAAPAYRATAPVSRAPVPAYRAPVPASGAAAAEIRTAAPAYGGAGPAYRTVTPMYGDGAPMHRTVAPVYSAPAAPMSRTVAPVYSAPAAPVYRTVAPTYGAGAPVFRSVAPAYSAPMMHSAPAVSQSGAGFSGRH